MTGIVHDENWIAELPGSVQHALAGRMTRHEIMTGATVKAAGDVPDAIYQVEEGYLKLMGLYPDGRNMLIELYSAGNCFGETAVIVHRTGHFHTTVALVPSIVRRLSREDFWEIYDMYPEVAGALSRKFAHRITRMFNAREIKATLRLRSQIACLLLDLAGRCGISVGDGALRVGLPISHNDIAEHLDVTRQAVQREVASLRRAGLIRQEQGGWTIFRPDALARI